MGVTTKYAPNIYENRYDHTSSRFRGFWHLINVWKGSVFKLIWHNFLFFVLCYFFISFLYRFGLQQFPAAKQNFDLLCIFAGRFSNFIPISFLTGFYVTQVVSRWWAQFMSLPWPDRIALKLVTFCSGKVKPFANKLIA